MDKLEKALQKARLDRERVLAEVTTMPPPEAAPAPPPEPARTRVLPLSPAELERHRLVARSGSGETVDLFRMLRTKVMQQMQGAGLRTLAITSPQYGDGKTTIAINLAMSLALDVKQTVLLVDADMRKPSVHDFLGIRPEAGLDDYLLRDLPISQCLLKPDIDRLVVLPVANSLQDSSELLGTPKMAKLAEELKTRYPDRIVIYDMPPLLTQDDTLAFLPLVDGVLLVVRDGVSPIADVRACAESLAGRNFLGTILNDSRFSA
ncbi:Capsular exopolysaccharide family [uncultured Alphaproteobacteria bacterium]|uniref:non-specific protein-tyrosine kinase n=1 Tax=uncultured Alphaproteobacteria bacterium TaxID=91750 RepID=A0A212JHX5_9PROT|nr:Capsular exopolysaccharide family [uncultured Alphaproteobacteria bacterium]